MLTCPTQSSHCDKCKKHRNESRGTFRNPWPWRINSAIRRKEILQKKLFAAQTLSHFARKRGNDSHHCIVADGVTIWQFTPRMGSRRRKRISLDDATRKLCKNNRLVACTEIGSSLYSVPKDGTAGGTDTALDAGISACDTEEGLATVVKWLN